MMGTEPVSDAKSRTMDWRRVGFAAGGAVLIVLILLLALRFSYILFLSWEYQPYKDLLYQKLQLSDALSSTFASALSFVYAIATTALLVYVPYIAISHRIFSNPRVAGRVVALFVSWMILSALPSVLLAMFGSDACFNQATGAPQKWYVEDSDGRITLFDSSGYDSSGHKKRPVTPSACGRYEAQHGAGGVAHSITSDLNSIAFYDPTTGKARVWYSLGADGKVRLFDAPGFDPSSGDELRPITKQIIERIRSANQAPKLQKSESPQADPVANSNVAENGGQPVSPSFDCQHSHNMTEGVICHDSALATKDVQMARLYEQQLSTVVGAEVREEQRYWLRFVRNKCLDAECLSRAYDSRIAQLVDRQAERETAPVSGDLAKETALAFYQSIGRGDGEAAANLVVPEKREAGPLSAGELNKFYRDLDSALVVDGATADDNDGQVTVWFHYRLQNGNACSGRSVMTLVGRGGRALIERIEAPTRC